MKKELLVLVDEKDNSIGLEEKVRCHLPDGKLHRAFTALLFDNKGRLVLTRRSPTKMLWPGDWDGTVASHPGQSETYVSSAERRIPEELGITCNMEYLFKFEYHVPYKDVGSENEICGTLLGLIDSASEFNLVKDEISEVKWLNPVQLLQELKKNVKIYCPWMLIAIYLLPSSQKKMLEKHEKILEEWMTPELRKHLESAIKSHLPDSSWRLVN